MQHQTEFQKCDIFNTPLVLYFISSHTLTLTTDWAIIVIFAKTNRLQFRLVPLVAQKSHTSSLSYKMCPRV